MAGDATPQNHEPNDGELLRQYVTTRSEAAFATLVRRHLDLVYNVALRKVGGDTHLAEDVAQRVFADLAAKANALQRHPHLTGWLFTGTHYVAAQLVRTERRRKAWEQKAHDMNAFHEQETPLEWERLRPLLDDLVLELSDRDREAVLLRYFEGRSFAEVGERLRLTDHGARARVDRAVDKLRSRLARRGITSTSAALGLALAAQAAAAAPPLLAASITGSAMAAATTTGALAAGTISFMSTTKIVAVGSTVLAILAVGVGVVQWRYARTAAAEIAALRQERAELAVQLARAEQRIKQVTTSAAAPTVVPPAPSASAPAAAATPSEPIPPAVTLEATKKVLASISMAGSPKWREIDSQHITNTRLWVERDPSGLLQWIATVPSEKQREHTTEAVIAIATETDPEFAFLLTGAIVRDAPRSNRRHEVIRAWAERDAPGATRAVTHANLPEGERERLLSVITLYSQKR